MFFAPEHPATENGGQMKDHYVTTDKASPVMSYLKLKAPKAPRKAKKAPRPRRWHFISLALKCVVMA